jgi:hypothetical protein
LALVDTSLMSKLPCSLLIFDKKKVQNTKMRNLKKGLRLFLCETENLYAVKNVRVERRARSIFTVYYDVHTGGNQNTYHLFPNKVAEIIAQKGVFRSS